MGVADLVVETPDEIAVIDHKSFGPDAAEEHAGALAGQLGSYADAIAATFPGRRISLWVHLALEGIVLEVVPEELSSVF